MGSVVVLRKIALEKFPLADGWRITTAKIAQDSVSNDLACQQHKMFSFQGSKRRPPLRENLFPVKNRRITILFFLRSKIDRRCQFFSKGGGDVGGCQ